MKHSAIQPVLLNSIPQVHSLLSLPKPDHPLVSVIDMSLLKSSCTLLPGTYIYNFYSICIKKGYKGKLKYGQNYYDFDDGVMTFFAPGQLISTTAGDEVALEGWWLIFHPDFIRNYPLGKTIKSFGYFSYAVSEALHLSEKEEIILANTMQNIAHEYRSSIDNYSQDVIISYIELILNYCNRFYNRQFITRKNGGNDLLVRLEEVLAGWFDNNNNQNSGLPTVQYVSKQLNVSPNYLSDLLRSLTGQTTQQHIHNKLIEKAKEILTTTTLSVGEIAYQLGFEYPQSFSKLFKTKTNSSPLEFRHSFN